MSSVTAIPQQSAANDMLQAIDTIKDVLADEADKEDMQGHLSRATSDALYAAGILRMKLPRVLGGREAPLADQFLALEKLATINSSAAWCSMVGSTSIAMPGAFLPDEGIQQMFAGGKIPRAAILIMPSAKAVKVQGGHRLTGRWAFASGVQHAEWIAAHALVESDAGSAPVLHMFVFPATEIRNHNNWQVIGLRGTGSTDISVNDLFVPDACCWNVAEQPPQRGGGLYGLGIPAFVAYEHAAVPIGLARLALDTLINTAINKKRGYAPGAKSLADREVVQRFVGRAELQWRAARELALSLNREADACAAAGKTPTNELSIQLRSVACYCTEVAADIINEAFRYSGAGAIYEGNVMQRCLRDISVAQQHLMVSEVAYELLGKTRLGFTDVAPMG